MKSTESISIKSEANISECGNYRYWLSRVWDSEKTIGAFICINPSKATSSMCDLTMCNCNNLAVQWGWGGFYIINLFAYMATDQSDMKSQKNPIGESNNSAITYVSNKASVIVLAWGNDYKNRAKEVISLLNDQQLYCINKNKGGGFLHPSRIKTSDYLHAKKI